MELLLDDDLDIDLDSLALFASEPHAAEVTALCAHEATAAEPPSDPVSADAAWFEAASPFGPLWLCVQSDGVARHAAAAAVALQQASPPLDALDDWSMLELDWRWTPIPQPADAGSHVVVRWPGDDAAAVAAHLVLPWTLVRHLPPPTGPLADAVRWEPAQATVVLARLALSVDDLNALEPGGALVMPESMHPDWQGRVRAAGEGLDAGAPLALATPHAPKVVSRDHATSPAVPDAGAVVCEVRLDRAPMLGIDRLAGWSPGDIGDPGSRASLWRCDGAGPPRRCAGGTLMPWGDGWALAFDA